jgi:N-acetylneuraminic acid mutarotase
MRYSIPGAQPIEGDSLSDLTTSTVSGTIILAADPTQPLEAATKQYVDNALLNLNASNITTGTIDVGRFPAFTGDITKAAGSANIYLTATGVPAGTYTKVTVNAKGRITAGGTLASSDIPNLDWSKITINRPTTLAGYGITDGISTSGGTVTGYLKVTPTSDNLSAIDKQTVDTTVGQAVLKTGDIITKPYSTTPPGFLRCNGAEVSKSAYSNLYAAVGDTFSNTDLMAGAGKPWKQQYAFNTTQNGDITGWTAAGNLPTALISAQSVVTKNRVYLIGGYNGTSDVSTVYTAPINADGTLGAWSTGPSLPIPISFSQVIVTSNKVYLLGGYSTNSYISSIYSATINSDGTLGSWSLYGSLPGPLGASQAVITRGRVYLLGGRDNSGNTNIVYTALINADGTLGSWNTGTNIYTPVVSSQAVVTRDKVYLLGGYGTTFSTYHAQIFVASINTDGTIGAWTGLGSIPASLALSQALVVKNRVYLLGGNKAGTMTSDVYSAPINPDGTLGTWTTVSSSLPGPLAYSQVITTNSKVYLLGGYAANYTSVIYSAPFSGGLNDYSPYYDGTITTTDPNNFKLPDYTSEDLSSGLYHYIKY